jgi:hypothetical protein
MKRILVALTGWLLVLSACHSTKNVTYGDGGLTKITEKGYITVVGMATDQLRRTAIKDDKGVYYVMRDIRGGWPSGVEGKKVKAHGKFLILDSRKLMKKTNYLVGGPVIMYVLADAKWEVIN